MDRSLSEITLYLFGIENRLLHVLAESYIVTAICFLAIALGCIAGLSRFPRASRRGSALGNLT